MLPHACACVCGWLCVNVLLPLNCPGLSFGSIAEISGHVCDVPLPWFMLIVGMAKTRVLHEHVWELGCGLWGFDTCPGLGLSLLRDTGLVPSPAYLSPSAFLPALLLQRRGTSLVVSSSCSKVASAIVECQLSTSAIVDIGDCGSSTLWTLRSLSFALSSLAVIHFTGTELDAPHHCGHASLQQEE